MINNQIKEKVMQVLLRMDVFVNSKITNEISENDNLETYGLDSFAFIKMIIELEQEFDIEIPSEYLRFEKWGTVRNIVESLYELKISNKSKGDDARC